MDATSSFTQRNSCPRKRPVSEVLKLVRGVISSPAVSQSSGEPLVTHRQPCHFLALLPVLTGGASHRVECRRHSIQPLLTHAWSQLYPPGCQWKGNNLGWGRWQAQDKDGIWEESLGKGGLGAAQKMHSLHICISPEVCVSYSSLRSTSLILICAALSWDGMSLLRLWQ